MEDKYSWEDIRLDGSATKKQVKAYKQPVHPQQSGLSTKITDFRDRVVRHTITHPLDTSKPTND